MPFTRLDRPRLALITGSSSGIGFALARKLAVEGYDIILTSANRAKLSAAARVLMREAPNVEVHIIVADLSVPDGARQLYTEIQLLRRPLDILVNNAGVAVSGKFSDTDVRDEVSMVQLNIISPMALTKLILPQMLRLHEGRILFVGDESALGSGRRLTAYTATKAFLHAFAKGLSEELKGTGVHVATIMPGPTKTDFFARADITLDKAAINKLAAPAEVAETAYEALTQDDTRMPMFGRFLAATGLQPNRKTTRPI